jgi:aminoglycoside N3'-acetyltransferase
MHGQPRPISDVISQLRALGVASGSVLLVHTSFTRVGPVEGGPAGLIEGIGAAVGPSGTLVMPSMSDNDEQPFDPRTTPCAGMGVVGDRSLLRAVQSREEGAQRRGPVGYGEGRIMPARAVVQLVTARLGADETTFLHPPGVDVECDEARASMPVDPDGARWRDGGG